MPSSPITLSQDRILIAGDLTFATVAGILDASRKLFPQQGPWNCDFSQVTQADSAGLALLVEWLKMAKQRQLKIVFHNLPPQLKSIAAPAGLNTLL